MDDSFTALLLEDTKDKMQRPSSTSARSSRRSAPAARTPRSSSTWASTTTATVTPLQQLAQFSVPDARMLVISPYEKNVIGAIEKAITASDLGISPTNDGIGDPPRRSRRSPRSAARSW